MTARVARVLEKTQTKDFPPNEPGNFETVRFVEPLLGNCDLIPVNQERSSNALFETISGQEADTLFARKDYPQYSDFSSRVVTFPPKPLRQNTFRSLQKWEGVVLEVEGDYFRARLVDLTCPGPDEEAEISIEELSPEDLELLEPGAVFYWNIGYHNSVNGQRTRASQIRFRRLPVWTKEDLEKAQVKATQIYESIQWE